MWNTIYDWIISLCGMIGLCIGLIGCLIGVLALIVMPIIWSFEEIREEKRHK